ncbi:MULTISPECIES: alpha/beta fold hydrolase [Flavobacteriaceae]|uniref:alpha/beta hydrolase family protein n=1 Tax=Flavobacteriaceae TaxID=49546 RepID=UPI00234BE1BE|nr:alpha/beta fold hydrolase [Muricauda sp. SP22]MDC6363627.1 alpha/beta fold hydrolase [Muricauda sp. SP22]
MTDDHFQIIATLWETSGIPKGYVQINPGTGIPQHFYRHFAKYLAQRGYIVITFDYRGIGLSKPKTLKRFVATIIHWGIDIDAVLDWGIKNYPSLKKTVVGHSMGGQLIGILKNAHKIDNALLIASGTGYWKDMPKSPMKYFMPLLWHVYMPLSTLIYGYANAKLIGRGENLPKGVALQWRRWCLSANYWEIDFGKTINQDTFNDLSGNIKSYVFSDDKITSKKSAEKLLKYFTKAEKSVALLNPVDFGLERTGHLGFFSRNSQPLWEYVSGSFLN